MAQELNCSMGLIGQYELGKCSPLVERAEEFAARLGVTLDELRASGPDSEDAA